MALSGVLSSCDTFAKNILFVSFAASASARASVRSAIARCSDADISLNVCARFAISPESRFSSIRWVKSPAPNRSTPTLRRNSDALVVLISVKIRINVIVIELTKPMMVIRSVNWMVLSIIVERSRATLFCWSASACRLSVASPYRRASRRDGTELSL